MEGRDDVKLSSSKDVHMTVSSIATCVAAFVVSPQRSTTA